MAVVDVLIRNINQLVNTERVKRIEPETETVATVADRPFLLRL